MIKIETIEFNTNVWKIESRSKNYIIFKSKTMMLGFICIANFDDVLALCEIMDKYGFNHDLSLFTFDGHILFKKRQ